jgi:hypothetical protein
VRHFIAHTRRAGPPIARPLNCGVMRHDRGVRYACSESLRLTAAVVVVTSLVAGCCSPMSCRPAVVGMERYDPLVHALADFRKDNGTYPDSLEQLVPTYLPVVPKGDANQRPSDPEYGTSGSGYVLSFRYTGPGLNSCGYDQEAGAWQCAGDY